MSPTTFHRLFRASAYYDLLITWPYATPITLALFWNILNGTHASFGLSPLPDLNAYATLFANFFGSVVLIWSVVRLRLNDARLARYDAVGRWLFSAWMLNALLNGASPLLWGFLAIELTFAVVQSLPVRQPQTT
ncbi:hypothetical protein shim_15760 [Shimia sp. SK013]|uniref:hypothetical protein n=1 Tax=Shimia sp. SK013 TaxID=1389006 RepID=UPI0006CDB761|nr:hypothetical protein [Shimia sp. SK013]KPA22129.1 hypothetical protein shim_15760 [Shimia sp. SK013]